KPLVSSKYARAVLMLLPALFMISVQLRQIAAMIKFAKMINARRPEQLSSYDPFSCANSDGSVDATCSLLQCHLFVPVIVGFFAIIEVAVTLVRGPLHSNKAAHF
ncbi:hypothetical protein BG015_005772, partial [Linnemannia schmuckeri]